MPQQNGANGSVRSLSGHSFQLAQAETGASPSEATGTTAETKAEEKHTAGEIPPASLLFMNSILVAVIMVVFALIARKRLEKIPRGVQNFSELMVEWVTQFTTDIIGPSGKKYIPLVGTTFVYILIMNLLGLIPGFHSPTSNVTITLALGVCIFIYVQYQGIRANGPVNYVKHFMGPMPALAPLMLPVELISEFVKPFTLAVRLFGNIFGEDVILIVLAGLGAGAAVAGSSWIPFQFPIIFLAVLTSVVQAMVFSILTCIYISLMTQHDHEGHGDEGSHDLTHAHATGH
jgi:F-type H+-transporting ATPase subunit a